MKPLVSISVPVYNAEKYLRQCLDSLVNQTLQEIEIVIVNDGSTDNSEAICREYAEKDSRVRFISKENGGSASARQTALDASEGLYICSCDADDWVESDTYEQLYKKAVETNADVVVYDYWFEYPDGRQTAMCNKIALDGENDLLNDALNGKFTSSVAFKMIRRDIFDKYSLSWEPGINLGEDFLMTLKILKHDVKVVYLPAALYHYRRIFGSNSYTNNISMDTFRQLLRIRQWVIANIDNKKYANGIFCIKLFNCFTALRVKDGISAQEYHQLVRQISYGDLLKYKYPKLKGLVVIIAKLFGYRFVKIVFKLSYKYLYN